MRIIGLLVLSLLFLSCSTTGGIKRPMSSVSSFSLIEANVTKGIDVKGSTAEPINPNINLFDRGQRGHCLCQIQKPQWRAQAKMGLD